MKRKSMITMLVIALMLVLSLTVLSACGKNNDDNKDDPPATYSVTVTNGTGGGEYAEGATVTITANAPETGKEFTSWTLEGVTVENTSVDELTFTMPAGNVVAKANYEFIDYTVTVTGGTANKTTAHYGDSITITAAAPETGKEFTSWTIEGVTVDDKTKAEITFTMPANAVTATANYGDKAYLFALENCTADKESAKFGEEVTFTADEVIGKRFDSWNIKGVDDLTGLDLTKSPLTITMPANDINVAAVLEDIDYTVSVTGGTTDKKTAHYGDSVTITADEITGREFVRWEITGLDTSGLVLTNAELTFTMPASDVTATALYSYIDYKATVVGGTAQVDADAEPTSEVLATYECPVSIFATAPTGQRFVRWTSDDGVVFANATSAETTFTMPAKNVTVTAVFEYIDYTVTVNGGTAYTDGEPAESITAEYGDYINIVAEVPTGKRFVKWTSDSDEVVFDSETSGTTSFEMPAKNVTVTAELRDLVKRSVTVQGGVAQVGDGELETSLEAYCGDTVTLTAYQRDDKTFVKWTIEGIVDTTGLDLTQRELTFTMPDNDVKATAEFENVPTDLTFEGDVATSGELRYVNYDSKSFRLPLGSGQDSCTYTIELSNPAFTFKVYGSDGEVYIDENGEGVKSITIDREDNYTIEVINTGLAANCTLTVTKV